LYGIGINNSERPCYCTLNKFDKLNSVATKSKLVQA
jgi:hypothetical protein